MFTRTAIPTVLGLGIALGFSVVAHADEEHEMRGAPADLAARELGVATSEPPSFSNDQAEMAKAIGLDVVCLCGSCPKRTIHECDCGWAEKNRNIIMNAILAGKTKDEVVGGYVKAYGGRVLALLPNEGVNILAWLLPYGGGLVAVVLIVRLAVRQVRAQRRRGLDAATASVAPNVAAGSLESDVSLRRELEQELRNLD